MKKCLGIFKEISSKDDRWQSQAKLDTYIYIYDIYTHIHCLYDVYTHMHLITSTDVCMYVCDMYIYIYA